MVKNPKSKFRRQVKICHKCNKPSPKGDHEVCNPARVRSDRNHEPTSFLIDKMKERGMK